MLTPAPEMTQFSIQYIEEIVQVQCCQMFSTTLKFEHSFDIGNYAATRKQYFQKVDQWDNGFIDGIPR